MHAKFIAIVLLGLFVSALAWGAQQGGGSKGNSQRWPDKLNEGDSAPDFTLKSPDGKTSFTLSSFKGSKPVVLIVGSYT